MKSLIYKELYEILNWLEKKGFSIEGKVGERFLRAEKGNTCKYIVRITISQDKNKEKEYLEISVDGIREKNGYHIRVSSFFVGEVNLLNSLRERMEKIENAIKEIEKVL